MEVKNIAQELSARHKDAMSIAAELREIASELTSLADSLESGKNLPQRIHATSNGERLRNVLSAYNAFKRDIDYLRNAIGWLRKD